eukprot:TRINITY_DN62605_c0_g1_i1.p2 TRINITY_DN62605_c0_g1~~TRINITY_DN62605_c0_g1_i1.p2  ORF type:complete len:115 (+),score=14.43 TRINITY_DN62605_c0_g1_i1:68-412(+)
MLLPPIFFYNVRETTDIYKRGIVGSVRCVQETGYYQLVFLSYRLLSVLCKSCWMFGVIINYQNILHMQFQQPLIQRVSLISSVLLLSFISHIICLLYTSPSPRDLSTSRMPSSA